MNLFLNFAATLFLGTLISFSSIAHGFEVSLETDLVGPILRLGGRTGVEQHWISPGILLDDHFIVRAEFFQTEGGNFSSSSFQSGGSGQVGNQNVETSMRGVGLGYCLSGCNTHSFRAVAGLGMAERKFNDTVLGPRYANGSMWFAELGYQWRWGNALTSLSWITVQSDLTETVDYSTPTAQLSITKNNPESLMKWGVGFYF
jgi:hypothetical protein